MLLYFQSSGPADLLLGGHCPQLPCMVELDVLMEGFQPADAGFERWAALAAATRLRRLSLQRTLVGGQPIEPPAPVPFAYSLAEALGVDGVCGDVMSGGCSCGA